MNKTRGLLLTAGFVLALAFTFSCSGDDNSGGGGDPSSSSGGETQGGGDPSSSSNGGQGGGNACTNLEPVTIGSQVWAKKDLDCDIQGSICYDNCSMYGRLYDWATAMGLPSSCNTSICSNEIQAKHKGICPAGWHIPSDAEWNELITFAGGSSTAGAKLKATNFNGTDNHGFTAMLGGTYYSDTGFGNIGSNGTWWSSSEGESYSNEAAQTQQMRLSSEQVYKGNNTKSSLYSVRCIKD